MPDTPFWHEPTTIGGDAHPPVLSPFDAEAPTIATVAMIKAAAERRDRWAELAAIALDRHALIIEAMRALSWEAVARKSAEPLAVVDQYLYRTARQIAEVLEAAGLPHSTPEDWNTPEAQEAIAQAELLGLPSIPEARDFGEQTRARHQQSILDALKASDMQRQAASLLLIEAWVSIAGEVYGAKKVEKVEDAAGTITAALRERLATPEGWRWVETLHLDLKAVLQSTDAVSQSVPQVPAFNADGRGHVMTDFISIGARHLLLSFREWETDESGRPVFTYKNKSGKALYAPSKAIFPTPEDALKAVEGYGDAHVGLLRYISAKYMVNKVEGLTGPYGGFYVSIEEFLDARGFQKHKKGGHRPEYARETVAMVRDLASIEVRGHVERYRKGKRGKPEELVIEAPLIVISQTIKKRSQTGEETPIAWYLRPGDWAAELEKLSPQYGVMYRSILRLNTQNDMNAWRIGNYLIEEYRIRAHQKSWAQPYRISTLLAGACIEVDRKNPKRFRDRIETALNVLANPDVMEPPVVASWKYPNFVDAKGRGWLDKWLESGVVIMPLDNIKDERYGRMREQKQSSRRLRT